MLIRILLNTIKQNRREIKFLKAQIGDFIMDIENLKEEVKIYENTKN